MSKIIVNISSTDRTKNIKQNSLVIENILTRQVDHCKFTISKVSGSSILNFKPEDGKDIVITNDGTRIFGGVIIRVTQYLDAYGILSFDCECEDYTRFLKRKLVADTYSNMTINAIISSMISTYSVGDDITTNNVNCSTTIDYIGFNYLSIAQCLTQLADLINYDWYVDYNKDIHFFAKTDNTAPFDIQDTDGSYVMKSLKIKRDNSQVRNVVYIRGGEYLGDTFTSEIKCDGTKTIFEIPYKYKDLSVTTSAATVPHSLSIGLDYVNPADDYDVLWNFQEKIIRFKDADKPSDGNVLRIGGRPYLPVRVKVMDQVAISEMATGENSGSGEYEHVIIDKSIKTKAAARERAEAELESYKETLSEGEFETYTDGLAAGQRIRINSTAHDIDGYYIINRVNSRMLTYNKLIYKVSVVTTKTFGIIEYLQKALTDETKKITIDADEIIDLIDSEVESMSISETVTSSIDHNRQTESISMNETFTAQSLNWETEFVLGPYTPSGYKRTFILDGSRLG